MARSQQERAKTCVRVLYSGVEVPEGPTKLSHKRTGIRMKPKTTKSISYVQRLSPLAISLVNVMVLLTNTMCIQSVYSFSSLCSPASGLVTVMVSWAALSTMELQFFEET